jgi:hypothetical protein
MALVQVKPDPTQISGAPITSASEFSLVQGGPLFQLMLRAGLIRPSMDMLARRIIAMMALGWVPLLVLTLLSGHALGGKGVPFLYDVGAHARLLLTVPALIAAEVIVHRRIRVTVQQFLDRGIVAPEHVDRFDSAIVSAMRLRNSVLAEALIAIFVVAGGSYLGRRYLALDTESWFAAPVGNQTHFTAAGYWYIFVSLAIFRFFGLRWYFRLFVWYRFLWQVSRHVPLQLNALHPDRAGGLAFLSGSVFAFQPVLIAHTIALSGILAGKIWHESATLPQFKMEIVTWILCLMLLVLLPLLFFITHLAAAKRNGLREYGIVGSRYVAEFRRKWIVGHVENGEQLIGTADIQSLADLSNSFEVVNEMRLVPFGRASVLRSAMMTALPLAPLLLTMIPLDQLVDRALRMFI